MGTKLKAKNRTGWLGSALVSVGDMLIPLVFAFIVGSVFSLICDTNPFTLYGYIIKRPLFAAKSLWFSFKCSVSS